MKNYIGIENNNFKVLKQKRENKSTYIYILCKHCNSEKWIRADNLSNKKVKSCGCLKVTTQFKEHNYTGKNHNNIIFLERTNQIKQKSHIYKCLCHCSKIFLESPSYIISNNIKSCGCTHYLNINLNIEKALSVFKEKYIRNGTALNMISRDKLLPNNSSGITGVTYDKSRNKWVAQLVFKNKKYFKRFDDIEEAIVYRKELEEKYFKPILDMYRENGE